MPLKDNEMKDLLSSWIDECFPDPSAKPLALYRINAKLVEYFAEHFPEVKPPNLAQIIHHRRAAIPHVIHDYGGERYEELVRQASGWGLIHGGLKKKQVAEFLSGIMDECLPITGQQIEARLVIERINTKIQQCSVAGLGPVGSPPPKTVPFPVGYTFEQICHDFEKSFEIVTLMKTGGNRFSELHRSARPAPLKKTREDAAIDAVYEHIYQANLIRKLMKIISASPVHESGFDRFAAIESTILSLVQLGAALKRRPGERSMPVEDFALNVVSNMRMRPNHSLQDAMIAVAGQWKNPGAVPKEEDVYSTLKQCLYLITGSMELGLSAFDRLCTRAEQPAAAAGSAIPTSSSQPSSSQGQPSHVTPGPGNLSLFAKTSEPRVETGLPQDEPSDFAPPEKK